MANIETIQPIGQETLPPQTSPELQVPADIPESRQEHKRQFVDGDSLVQIKRIYESWPEKEYGVTLKQALSIYNRNVKKSYLVKTPEQLEEIKKEIELISQECGIKPSKLSLFNHTLGYEEIILKQFGDDPKLKISTLKNLFRNYPNISYKKRQELASKAIENESAYCEKRGIKKGQHIKPKTAESVGINPPPKDEIPSIETCPITGKTFHEKFRTTQALKRKFSTSRGLPKNLKIQKAIRLVHPNYRNTETKPLSFEVSIPILDTWFQDNLPNFGIENIKDIDYKSLLPFLNANPQIAPYFDYQPSETKLGESTFRMITTSFPGEHFFEIQKLVSEYLYYLPIKDRSESTVKTFLEKCKNRLSLQTDPIIQKKLINEIYHENN